MSPWKAALAGTLSVLVLLLIGISYIGWREHLAKERKIKKREDESDERDQMKSEKKNALSAKGKLGQQGKPEIYKLAEDTLCHENGEIKSCQRTPRKAQDTKNSTGAPEKEKTMWEARRSVGVVMSLLVWFKPCHVLPCLCAPAYAAAPTVELSSTIFSPYFSFKNKLQKQQRNLKSHKAWAHLLLWPL